MNTPVLSTHVLFFLTVMSISGVAAWWSKNILGDNSKVRFFAIMGSISAIFMVFSMW